MRGSGFTEATVDSSGDPDHDAAAVHDRRWRILMVLCLSLLIVTLGNSSLNLVIPTLSRQLHATGTQLQWVIAIYSLVFAGLLFSTGAIGDRFGRKGMLQFGLLLFSAGCIGATLSTDMNQLIVARGVMGMAAAFIMPSTLSILVNVFPPHERTKAIAIWAGVTGGAGALGPVMSGMLIDHFWYGSVFLVNLPFATLALVAGFFLVPKSKDPEHAQLDPVGAVLSIIGIVSIVYGLIEAPEKGWSSATTLGAFAFGAVVLAVFVFWERHHDEPMLDIRYFRNGAFSAGTSGMILVFMAMYGIMFLLSQYFQLVLGYDALGSALRLLPIGPIMIVVAPLTPWLSERFGANRTVSLGLLLVGTSMFLFLGLDSSSPYWHVIAVMAPLFVGAALSTSSLTSAIMSAVPPRRAGAGSAMNDATRELGAALGVAVMGSIAVSEYTRRLGSLTASLPAAAQKAAESSLAGALETGARMSGPDGAALISGARSAFVDSMHSAVTVGGVLAVTAALVVVRYLPKSFAHHGASKGPLEAIEDVAELAIAGIMPVFDDDVFASDPVDPAAWAQDPARDV